jgi:hypothetical protein
VPQKRDSRAPVSGIKAGKKIQLCASLFLVAATSGLQAADPSTNIKSTLAVIHEQPKPTRRDPWVLLRKDFGRHYQSDRLFSVRADYSDFAFNDDFTRRQGPCVVGLRASFSF